MALATRAQHTRNDRPVADYRAYVVEDHARMRSFIVTFVSRTDDLTVTGQAATAEAALTDPDLHTANLVITDLSLPGMSGVELTRRLCKEDSERPIIVLSAMVERYYVEAALDAGARAFVAKDCLDKLEDVILRVLAGEEDIRELPIKVGSQA